MKRNSTRYNAADTIKRALFILALLFYSVSSRVSLDDYNPEVHTGLLDRITVTQPPSTTVYIQLGLCVVVLFKLEKDVLDLLVGYLVKHLPDDDND